MTELAPDPPTGTTFDRERIAAAVREILLAIGEDPERDGLARTPLRIADMYAEIFAGLHEDGGSHLAVRFEAQHDEMILVRDIPMYSMCEHPIDVYRILRSAKLSQGHQSCLKVRRVWAPVVIK